MKERYEGIDGLKAYAILGIVLMHVLSNGNFNLTGFVFKNLIPSFTNLVFLFMMVSGFGMCCGYYQKFKDKQIDINEFYKKRYNKIWPYFAMLCILDFLISPSKNALYEVVANLTLCQGLLPNMNISIIGVSWTLAVIFVFYLLFPFFVFLLDNKKRAWLSLICALFYNFVCNIYFFDEAHIADKSVVNFSSRTNILYCAIYFVMGGLIYLYKKEIKLLVEKNRMIVIIVLFISLVGYFILGSSTITILIFCVMSLTYTFGCNHKGILVNPVAHFVGEICFEIYLCHMIIYRIFEKMSFIHLFKNDLISYVFISIAVIGGSIIFAKCANCILNKVKIILKNRRVNYV